MNVNDYNTYPSTSFVAGTLLSAEDTKTIRFTPEVEQSEFRHEVDIKCIQIFKRFLSTIVHDQGH